MTAFLWQTQTTPIQHKLNASHHLGGGGGSSSNGIATASGSGGGGTNNNNITKKKEDVYYPLIEKLKKKDKKNFFPLINTYSPFLSLSNISDKNDINIFDECITNLTDLRRIKVWAKYMMSDNIVRFGTVQKHPVYTALPGWLVDVLNLRRQRRDLIFLWCTDLRGVDQCLGSLCSIINLHYLLRRLEKKTGDNFTALLLQMTVLSTISTNPINRRGLKFPSNGMTSCTFEDIRRSIMKNNKKGSYDKLESMFTRIACVVPHKVGTNYFDLMMMK